MSCTCTSTDPCLGNAPTMPASDLGGLAMREAARPIVAVTAPIVGSWHSRKLAVALIALALGAGLAYPLSSSPIIYGELCAFIAGIFGTYVAGNVKSKNALPPA